MKPSEPPALPIVDTITISVEVIAVRERKKNAKKKSAAIVGPSSITPNESVRYEFTPQSRTASAKPETMERTVGRFMPAQNAAFFPRSIPATREMLSTAGMHALLLALLIAQETPPVSTSTETMLQSVGDHRALLRKFEDRIGGIQLRIGAAQEKVDVLKDTVLDGLVSKAKSRIVHANDMKGKFLLSKATYTL